MRTSRLPMPTIEHKILRWLLIALPLLVLPLRYWWITHTLYTTPASVFDLGFGFGDYTRNVSQLGEFRSCLTLPFKACHPGVCALSTRMPALPMAYASLASLAGFAAVNVAIAKCVFLAALVSIFLALITQDLRPSKVGVAALYLLYFGLQPLKHGATLEYEEGLLIDLSVCLAIAVVYLVRVDLPVSRLRRACFACLAVALGTAMYFSKSTALLTLVVILTICLTMRELKPIVKLICCLVVLVPFVLWTHHNYQGSGRFELSSSWNGENLFRGYNSGAAQIYPEISLDRAFDKSSAILSNGRVVPLGDFSDQRCFDGEWQWNDFYAKAAREWLLTHRLEALRFDLKKIWVALVEVRETPTYLSESDKTPLRTPAIALAMLLWMLYARILFFAAVALSVLAAYRRHLRRHLWIPAMLGAACAPYALVFGWQRHMVPVLMMAGTVLVFLFMAQIEIRRHRHVHA